MFRRTSIAVALLAVLVLAAFATPAWANSLVSANANVTCTNYQLSVSAHWMDARLPYTIDYSIVLMPAGGGPSQTISGVIPVVVSTQGTFSTTITEPLGPLTGDYTLSGSASLMQGSTLDNTLPIQFTSTTVTCAPPPPPPCSETSSNNSNFNGTSVPGGDFIWFNANFTASGIPSSGAVISFTNSTITADINGLDVAYPAPNAQITFSPSASCSSVTFNSMTNTFDVTVPVKGDDEIFLDGLALQLPSGGLPGGVNSVTWTGTFSTDNIAGVGIQWKWGAAAYSSFTTNYNQLAIKAGHQTACGQSNGDHAGTPEGVNNNGVSFKDFVVGGARGGGGSNWTGSWSGTVKVVPQCGNGNAKEIDGVLHGLGEL